MTQNIYSKLIEAVEKATLTVPFKNEDGYDTTIEAIDGDRLKSELRKLEEDENKNPAIWCACHFHENI